MGCCGTREPLTTVGGDNHDDDPKEELKLLRDKVHSQQIEVCGTYETETNSPMASMPLAANSEALRVLTALCNCSTRLSLAQVCPETERSVAAAIRKDSGPPLSKLGITLSGTLPLIACSNGKEVPAIVKAASGSQFLVCVSQCCALLFAKQKADRWLVAVHCDDREVAVVGWKQPAAEFSQRPIQDPITEKPTAKVSLIWESNVGGFNRVVKMANCGDAIAVGMTNDAMALLNTRTGAVVSDSLKGRLVAVLDKQRVVGVRNEGMGKWVLYEFAANTLIKEVPIEAGFILSVKASANGKRLYVCDSLNNQLLEYCTGNWQLTARIPLSGKPFGQCDIAANGLLAQGIYHREDSGSHYEDYSYHIEVVEANSGCVTQTMRTKHTNDIRQVVFSPDSSRIVSVSDDKSVQLFDAITGQMVAEPRVAHSGCVYAVCFLTDALFVTVSRDKSIVFWHCDSQPATARIEDTHDDAIFSVLRLSTDSFVTGDGRGTVKQWKLELE